MSYSFSAIVEKEGRLFVALCPELDVASQGKTIDAALKNLKEAVALFLETASPKELKSHLSSRARSSRTGTGHATVYHSPSAPER